MIVAPIHRDVIAYLKKRGLLSKFNKQLSILKNNIRHPSLNLEILEPRELKVYSFRVDKKYRATFIYISPQIIEIIEVNNHYR